MLNKIWTFEDRNFSASRTLLQLGKFIGFSSIGGLIQITMVLGLVEEYQIAYPLALIFAVLVASIGNFVLNKKFTFKEKIWS